MSPYPISNSGNYALTVTDALGCTFTDQINIPFMPNGTGSCAVACTSCNIDGLQGSNEGSIPTGELYCEQLVVHNPYWVGFVAGSNTISLEVTSTNCIQGDGLQLAFLEDCSSSNSLFCNPGCPGCGNLPLSLSYNDLIPGENYWLVIDGYAGDVCDFKITITSGSTIAPIPSPPAVPSGPVSVCPEGTVVYSIPAAAGAGFYLWSAPAGASINGAGNTLQVPAPQGTMVTVTFGQENGSVCVQAGNSCQPLTAPQCLDMDFQAQPTVTTILPLLHACPGTFIWGEEPYTTLSSPGTYTLTSSPYAAYQGCDSIVQQTIIIPEPIVTNLAEQVVCASDCPGCVDGPFTELYFSYLGCDSIVTGSRVLVNTTANIAGNTEITCEQPQLTLYALGVADTKTWTNQLGQTIGTGDSILITEPGFYTLTASTTAHGLTCVQTDTVTITLNTVIAFVSITGSENGCSTDSLVLNSNSSVQGAQYQWSGPNGFNSLEQNPAIDLPGIYTVTVTSPGGCFGTASASVDQLGGTPDVFALDAQVNCYNPGAQISGGSATPGTSLVWTDPAGNQFFGSNPGSNLAGTYVLTATGPFGCSNTAVAFLTYDQEAPQITLPDTVDIICQTFPTILCTTTSSDAAFAWTGPDGFTSAEAQFPAFSPGIYQVIVTDLSSGCTASDDILVLNQPHEIQLMIDEILQPTGGQNNGSIRITPILNNHTFSYTWTRNDVFYSQAQDILNLGPGIYRVTVTDNFGCSTTETFVLQFSATGEAGDENGKWQVSPNPGTGRFVLTCTEACEPIKAYVVFDQSGRRLLENYMPAEKAARSIDISGYPSGVYMLHLKTDASSYWLKLLLQR